MAEAAPVIRCLIEGRYRRARLLSKNGQRATVQIVEADLEPGVWATWRVSLEQVHPEDRTRLLGAGPPPNHSVFR